MSGSHSLAGQHVKGCRPCCLLLPIPRGAAPTKISERQALLICQVTSAAGLRACDVCRSRGGPVARPPSDGLGGKGAGLITDDEPPIKAEGAGVMGDLQSRPRLPSAKALQILDKIASHGRVCPPLPASLSLSLLSILIRACEHARPASSCLCAS